MNRPRITSGARRDSHRFVTAIKHLLHGLAHLLLRSWRRVPVMLQLIESECGAACVAMILSYYGRKTRVAEVRDALDIGRDGASALSLVQIARQFGLRVKAFSVQPAAFEHLSLPAIVHWNFNHFLVVERWSPTRVVVIDPAIGRRTLTAEEFDAGFTGVVLTMEPGEQFDRQSTPRPSMGRRYLHDIWNLAGTRRIVAQLLGASLVLQLLGLALPLSTKVLVDQVLPLEMTQIMPILAIGGALLILAQIVTTYLRAVLLVYLQGRLDTHLMVNFFAHVLSLPFRFFQQRSTGDLITRISSNMLIREMLTEQTMSAVLDGTLVVGYMVVVLVHAPQFGLLVLGLALLQVALLLATTQRVAALTQRHLSTQSETQGYLVEALTGIATLKASGAEEQALSHWSNLFYKQLNVAVQRSHLAAVIDTALVAIRTFSPLILLWVGAQQVLAGSMSLGTMLALQALGMACLSPLASLVTSGQQLQLVGAYLERIADVVDAEPEQSAVDAEVTPQLAGRIELKQVSFRYDSHAPSVLRDISLTIELGQKVALVGRTGSGKSTLAMLLLGLYIPTEGEILYDGVSLQQLNYRATRSQFGVVLQEPSLFSGSIRQNISLNNPGMSLDQVMAAAKRAAIHDDIMRMPMGYETHLAETGRGLSGGQRQRIALARALANTPTVVLLDEATSHLDVVTERVIDQNLNDLACTRIVVAHRLSTIRNADLILVIDHGQIVERGTHDELLIQNGQYAQLVQSQSDTALVDVSLP